MTESVISRGGELLKMLRRMKFLAHFQDFYNITVATESDGIVEDVDTA